MVEKNQISADQFNQRTTIKKDQDPVQYLVILSDKLNPDRSCQGTAVILSKLCATRYPKQTILNQRLESIDNDYFPTMIGLFPNIERAGLIEMQLRPDGILKQNHWVCFYRPALDQPFLLLHSWIGSTSLPTWSTNINAVQKLTLQSNKSLFKQPRLYIIEWLQRWLDVNENGDKTSYDQVKTILEFILSRFFTVSSLAFRCSK